ncbi:MAG: ribosome assembly cofactor RimP [Flavobacteriaceae bacterium]|nr:ribosome assembly cofactor RimP [Flavobacteriaceae bacterium]MCY4253647.1 ribosome assembly cofactor RimP [Flavobacteriaceae bacterium]
MDLIHHIKQIVEKILKPERDLYAVETNISQDGNIRLVLDSDNKLSLSECIRIHKRLELQMQQVESSLNYSIEVTSVGIGTPLTLKRQYFKRIGRKLSVTTHDNQTVKGRLNRVDDDHIELLWKTREKKEIGKGKRTVVHQQCVEYDQIFKAKEVV